MDDVGIQVILGHRQAALERVEGTAEARIGVLPCPDPRRVAPDAKAGLVHVLAPEAADLDGDEAGQLAAQVLDVHAGATVHVRGVLVREQRDPLERRHGIFLPWRRAGVGAPRQG